MVSRRSSHGGEEDHPLHFAFSNRFERDCEMEEQGVKKLKKTLGWAGIPCSQEIARRGGGKRTPPYIDNGYGSHNLKV